MTTPQVVTHQGWQQALGELRAEEKRETRRRDALAARRRRLPAEVIDKPYRFSGPGGEVTLLTRDDGERFGLSVFVRDGDRVLRTYFTDNRGVEALGSVWTFLDLTPLGRQEKWEDSPAGAPQEPPFQWWRRHDEYEKENA